jgi:predicted nucleic acid-binding protein
MYLLDTNIWLERLLDQEKSNEVRQFLDYFPSEHLCITDFSLHSIAIILSRLKRLERLKELVDDLFQHGAVALIRLDPGDLHYLIGIIGRYQLDFDDAYQYVAAEKHNLTIVSFDTDFDRTELGRKAPAELL